MLSSLLEKLNVVQDGISSRRSLQEDTPPGSSNSVTVDNLKKLQILQKNDSLFRNRKMKAAKGETMNMDRPLDDATTACIDRSLDNATTACIDINPFKGLSMGQPIPTENPELAVGCQLLSHYQNCWQDQTNAAEYNNNIANEIDESVGRLYNEMQNKKRIWNSFSSELASLDEIITSTESIVNMIGKLRMDVSEIEEDLIRLENLVETEEFYRKQGNERMKLNLYREQKLENLDKYRASLSRRHVEKLMKKEEEESFVKQVKAEALEQRFQRDLDNYKTFGVLPEPSPHQANPNLCDVELDQNSEELANYLAD